MATGFSTRSGPDGYRLNFDTDNLDYYFLMQKIARHCVDGKPAADVVEVVRCGECRHAEDSLVLWCTEHEQAVNRLDFCSHGARMDKEDKHEAG